MDNITAKELLQEILSNLDKEHPMAKRIETVLTHKTYLEQREEISQRVAQARESKLDIERRKLALRERAANLKAEQQQAKSTRTANSLWPVPKNQEEADRQQRERIVLNTLVTHMGVKRLRVETCLRGFRTTGIEMTLDEAKSWLGID